MAKHIRSDKQKMKELVNLYKHIFFYSGAMQGMDILERVVFKALDPDPAQKEILKKNLSIALDSIDWSPFVNPCHVEGDNKGLQKAMIDRANLLLNELDLLDKKDPEKEN